MDPVQIRSRLIAHLSPFYCIIKLGSRRGKVTLVLMHIVQLTAWIAAAKLEDDRNGPLFRPMSSARVTMFVNKQ
jgi:hypothetical protein